MSNNKTITINGRLYDAVTGLPVKKTPPSTSSPKPAPRPVTPTAKAVHTAPQRSATLRRSVAKKPVSTVKHPTRGRSMDISRSARVSKFAPHPSPVPKAKMVATTPDKAPQAHPVAERALAKTASSKKSPSPVKQMTSKEVKDAAIATVLNTPTKRPKRKRSLSPWKRRIFIGAFCLAIIVGSAWAVYRFVPSVSVSIAAAQAGVSASYPEYTPDGFRLHHPVTYSEGEVVLIFASNSNDDAYTITQTKSSWDSTAVLDNIVRKAVGENYGTTTERGLTLYTYGTTNASWVNKGILYTITSDARLTNEQIRRIATSL